MIENLESAFKVQLNGIEKFFDLGGAGRYEAISTLER